MKRISIISLVAKFAFLLPSLLFAQKPNYTANNKVNPYTGDFAYGCNIGYYGGYNNNATNDKLMADLLNNAGFHTTRPALYDFFLEQYGTDIRKPEFSYYTETLGMKEMTLFISGPSDAHRDESTIVCDGVIKRSQMFKNLYLPIWIEKDGVTQINPQNYFAAYVYKLATHYGKHVKFYEVWNEPDFTYGAAAWSQPGSPGNWYENDPTPCDLTNMYAHVQSYIRTMRIAYEVIKSVDPNAYVTTGGIGYEGFLDALLRNTDNPDGGKVTAEYPLKGGAYFDVLSYHVYPQYNMSTWDNALGGFRYARHSDNATTQVFLMKDRLNEILIKFGYEGKTYPEKHFILTEVNIPRKSFPTKDFIGSAEAQRNFLIKTFVVCQKQNIRQMYTYMLGDNNAESASVAQSDGFDLMGMYYDLNNATPATAKLTPAGVGSKSVSDFLYTYKYDAAQTAAMNLPANVDGGAFVKGTEVRFVLWAKTSVDNSEIAAATYTFPAAMKVTSITSKAWDYTSTSKSVTQAGNVLVLTGDPVFITTNGTVPPVVINPLPVADAGADKSVTTPQDTLSIAGKGTATAATIASYEWTKVQGPAVIMANASSAKLVLSKLTAGIYQFNLTVKDSKGGAATDQVQVTVSSAYVAPVVQITSPGASQAFNAGVNVSVKSLVTGSETIKTVSITVNGTTQTLTAAPFEYTLITPAAGNYTAIVKATDAKGTISTSSVAFTVLPAAPAPLTLPYKITFPQVSGFNKFKDQTGNVFYKSTVRIQVETTNASDIAYVDYALGTNKNTDNYPDTYPTSPVTYYYHNTYYALSPGAYNVTVSVTNKKGIKTQSVVSFTISNESAPSKRGEDGLDNLVENGPYSIYTTQGVMVAQGNGQLEANSLSLASGLYILKTPEKTVRFVVTK